MGRFLFINGAYNLLMKHVSHTFINLDNEIGCFILELCCEIVWPLLTKFCSLQIIFRLCQTLLVEVFIKTTVNVYYSSSNEYVGFTL